MRPWILTIMVMGCMRVEVEGAVRGSGGRGGSVTEEGIGVGVGDAEGEEV